MMQLPRTGDLVEIEGKTYQVAAHLVSGNSPLPDRLDVHLVLVPLEPEGDHNGH